MTVGPDDDAASREAAEWLARLNQRAVTTESLRAFDHWRHAPGNAAAYARVEAMWRAAGRLEGDPDIEAAIDQALARSSPRPARLAAGFRSLALATVVVIVGAIAALVWLNQGTGYTTKVGEQRLIQLADGSSMRLNTASRASVAYSAGERRIELIQGQAFFDVASDQSRPFIVEAGAIEVRALGTRFDVRRDSDRARVTLVEGRVEVREPAEERATVVLEAGEQAVRIGEARPLVARADVAAATTWTTGRIVLRDTPLREAVAEINRYSATQIMLDPQAPADTRVNGVFDPGDADAFLTAVTTLLPLKATRASADEVVLRAS